MIGEYGVLVSSRIVFVVVFRSLSIDDSNLLFGNIWIRLLEVGSDLFCTSKMCLINKPGKSHFAARQSRLCESVLRHVYRYANVENY